MNLIKTTILFGISIFLISSCASEKYQIVVEPSGTRIIKGMLNRTDLECDSTFTWYKTNYESYTVDSTTVNDIAMLSNGIHFVLVMGTWCGDSKREVPQLFKIFDAAKISEDNLLMVGVDRSKKSENGLIDQYNIQRVPTLIVLKGDQELGRIVESPRETLEKDIIRILQKQ